MKLETFLSSMRSLYGSASAEKLGPDSRIVISSDLHLGDGSRRDDALGNASVYRTAMERYYLERGFKLVLNGDIEELHKFELARIERHYEPLYAVFDRFAAGPGLVKLIGNHDLGLRQAKDCRYPVLDALRFAWGEENILVFHGHQAYNYFTKYNHISDFFVRFFAKPLNIHNDDVAITSDRRYKAERRIYFASKELGIVSLTGHTHRPLFESHSKYDALRMSIEDLLRRYSGSSASERVGIEESVAVYAKEFRRLSREERKRKVSRSLYSREELLVPCVFNSGCATGRSGFTVIEIENGSVALAFWSRDGGAREYVAREAVAHEGLPGYPYERFVIAREALDYVFARSRLLR